MKFDHIITPELRLLESLQRGADPLTRKNLQIMHENFVVPYSKYLKSQFTLMEAEMTADQIQQVFGHAERIASAGGDNKTMLGKGADAVAAGAKGAKDLAAKLVPQAVKDKFTKSLPAADAGPVEGFEQKATQAIAGIQDPKAKQSLMDKIKIGLQNPATQQLIMAGVSGIAGVIASTATAGLGGYAGAAAAGAITGSLLGAVNAKMQGKSWGDAGKAALKGAAMGAAGGLIGKGVTDVASAGMDAYNSYQQQQATAGEQVMPVQGASLSVGQELPNGEKITGLDSSNPNAAVTITKPDGGTYTVSRDTAHSMTGQQGISNQATAGGPVYGGASSDPMAGVSDPNAAAGGGMKNPDGSAMTNAQVKAAMDRVAPVAGGDADPNKYYNSLSPEQQRATDDAIVAQARGAQATGVNNPAANGQTELTPAQSDRMTADTMRAGALDAGKQQGSYTPTGNAYVDHLNQAAANGIRLRGIQKQSRVNTGTPVIEYIDRELTARMWILHESVGKPRGGVHLTEAGIGDMFKKAGNWLKTKASNLTNKVTADKLQQAWTKAGSPTESTQVAAIMAQAGVPQETVDQIFKNMGIPNTPASPTADPQGRVEPTMEPQDQEQKEVNPGNSNAPGSTKPAQTAAQDQEQMEINPGNSNAPGSKKPAQATAPASSTAAAPESGSTADAVGGAIGGLAQAGGETAADAIGGMASAWDRGVGMGATGQSVADQSYGKATDKPASAVKIKDAQGQEHNYKKVGQQWFDKDNKPVNAAQAAMLDQHAKQQAALGAKAPAQQPDKMLANPKDPKTGKPIDPKAQAAAGGAQQPAQAGKPAQAAAGGAAGGAQQPAGKPAQPSATPAAAGQAAPANKGNYDPDTGAPMSDKAKSDAAFAASPQGQAIQAKVDAMPAPSDAGQPAQAQSPEEIRKAKQATAAKTAQDQMAANAAAPAAAKAHTGGKVAGQVSMTPNAIRKREQRAAAAAQKAAPNDVMARMAKQLAPAQPAATPNFGQQQTGYANVKYNVPTSNVPVQPAIQPTTGAKAVPTQQPAAAPATAPTPEKFGSRGIAGMDAAPATAPAAPAAETPGFLQSKIKGRKQPEMAGMDFSAMLARKAKIRL